MHRSVTLGLGLIFIVCILSCTPKQTIVETIDGQQIRIVFNDMLHSRIFAKFDGKVISLGDFSASEYIEVSGETIDNFIYKSKTQESIEDDIGKGHRYLLKGATESIQ